MKGGKNDVEQIPVFPSRGRYSNDVCAASGVGHQKKIDERAQGGNIGMVAGGGEGCKRKPWVVLKT